MEAWDFTLQLAKLNQHLKDLSHSLRTEPDIASSVSGIDLCIYGPSTVIELFVECTDHQARIRTWWFDIRKEHDGWSVNHMISTVEDGASDTIHDENVLISTINEALFFVVDRVCSIPLTRM